MKYDIAVIGGGPAGMIAAGRAGELGARVILIEKNDILGKKLLITGKGRCNITNAESNMRTFCLKLGKKGKFLYSSFRQFNSQDIIEFFENYNVITKTERGNRIFPKSDNAKNILDALTDYLYKSKVEILKNKEVVSINKAGKNIKEIKLSDGSKIKANRFIITTGGKSYPLTGSTGDAYGWLEELGHKIIKPSPSLVPVIVKENFIKELEGLNLKNVKISIYKSNKLIDSRFGEAIFTSNGMSGPIILDLSKQIGELLPGKVELRIDFKPALDFKKLDERIQRDFQEFNKKLFKNSLDRLLPKKLIPIIIRLSEIDPDRQVNIITKEERKRITHLLKEFKLEIKTLEGFNKAIVTSGGVDLKEVDPKNLQSKIIDNLYFAGEILDLDGPTGGYNLQVCWSTGYAAGSSAV